MQYFAMRLLSFLTQIEDALNAESPAIDGGAWETMRMVNYHHAIARLTISPRPGNELPAGAVFVQSFALADGSVCLKASLNWKGRDVFPVFSVYSTPRLNWKLEASRIALAWLEGPSEVVTCSPIEVEMRPLQAAG
jgi:hypothetical protein